MQPSLVLKPLSETFGVVVDTTVIPLPSIPGAAIRARLQVETAGVRCCFDGKTTSVTTGVGFLLNVVGTTPEYFIEGWDNLNLMRMRCTGSTAGTMNIIYEGEYQP
jgi:hypothetical protein